MNTVRDILHDADPLRHEPSPRPEDRDRLRRAVVTAASETDVLPRPRFRAVAVPGVAVLLVLGILAAGSQIWRQGGATLQAAIRFEVRLAEDQPGPGLRQARVAASDRVVYLYPDVVVWNEDIGRTEVIQSGDASHFGIRVEFTVAGAQKMRRATAGHVGGPVAILIDGEVIAAPVLRSPIAASAMISGDYTKAEAGMIADGIRMR